MIMPFVCLAVENTPINEEADIKERQTEYYIFNSNSDTARFAGMPSL